MNEPRSLKTDGGLPWLDKAQFILPDTNVDITYLHGIIRSSCGFKKGTRCLGSVGLVFEKRSVTVCYKMHMVKKIL